MPDVEQADKLSTFVIDDPSELPALQAFFDRLEGGPVRPNASHRLAYLRCAWDRTCGGPASRLNVICVKRDDNIVAVWPLYLDLDSRALRHLGSGSNEEYSGLICEDATPSIARTAAARALAQCDVLEVYNLLETDALAQTLRDWPHTTIATVCPIITVGPDPNAWRASKSKSFRQSIRNARNRLSKVGDVSVGLVAPTDAAAFARWLFDSKRAWLDGRGKGRTWVHDGASEAFFADLMGRVDSGVAGYALTLDGNYIAGCILLFSKDIEFFIVANDPAYATYSPGQQLLDGLIDLASQKAARIDLRLTAEDYKLRWADTMEERYTYYASSTWRGRQFILTKKLGLGLLALRKIAGRARRRLWRG